ncbi:hypothetical protein NYE54_08060 [Paenibacillus sp. FSL K6-1330]|uniref:hypothetical protein n=1 Tax=Paenibacillus sp. FSL K6-1330 TaxID=2975292 RepID=UPI0030DCA536
MELRLNAEHLQELNDEQLDHLKQWWVTESYEGDPLLTTTQMIELLGSLGVGISIFVPMEESSSFKGKESVPDDDEELFNNMWGVVKEHL